MPSKDHFCNTLMVQPFEDKKKVQLSQKIGVSKLFDPFPHLGKYDSVSKILSHDDYACNVHNASMWRAYTKLLKLKTSVFFNPLNSNFGPNIEILKTDLKFSDH